MKSFYIAEIKTTDGLLHQGIYSAPQNPRKRAILWMHGLSAAFYNDIKLFESVAQEAEKLGWGFAHFNNRGHDLIAGIRKYDGTPPNGYSYYPGGAGQEIFEESVFDIEAGIAFLVEKGFEEVILIGHSTGANKVCYFAATQKNPRVIGVVLSGAMSDRLDPLMPAEKRKKDLVTMKQYITEGRGDEMFFGFHFFPITPKRYVSLFEPGSSEDVFDYGDPNPKMTHFARIMLPLLVVLGGADEYADRPIVDIQKIFDGKATSKQYKSVIIPDALHKFHGKENVFAQEVIGWGRAI